MGIKLDGKDGLRFIGSAKISDNKRVTLIEDVAAILGAGPGDNVLFFLDEAGRVVIDAAKRVKVQ